MESSNPLRFKELCLSTGPRLRSRLRDHVEGWLTGEVPLPGVRALVLLAIEEAVSNVVEHGYRGAAGRPIQLRFSMTDASHIHIRILDRAPGIDVTSIHVFSLSESADLLMERGRGLALLRRLTDSMTHQPRDEGGNVLDLVLDMHRLGRLVKETHREAA